MIPRPARRLGPRALTAGLAAVVVLSATVAPALGSQPRSGAALPRASKNAVVSIPHVTTFSRSAWSITGLSGGIWVSSPVVAAIDGVKAVVQATLGGEVLVLNAKNGRELPGWPQWVHIHSSTPTAVDSSPAVAYLDGPGRPPSIVVGAGSLWRSNQQGGVEAFNANGSVRFVFQTKRTFRPWGGGGGNNWSDPVFATPAVGDITGNGQQDIVFGSYDHYMYALQPDGKLLPGFPIQRYDTIWSSPALVDVSHTGRMDIIEGGDSSGYDGCYGGWLVDYRYWSNSAHLMWQKCVGETIWSSPTIGVINSTGRPAIVVGTSWDYQNPSYLKTAAADEVFAFYADNGAAVRGWPVHTDGPTFGSPSIGYLDGQFAVVSSSCAHCHDGSPIPLNGPATVTAWNGSGHTLWSRSLGANTETVGSPSLVDLSGGRDHGNDVLIGDPGGLYLLAGNTGNFMYNTGASRSAIQNGCDAEGSAAVGYVPGGPKTGWMLFVACGGPVAPGKLIAYPLVDAPSANTPPAWPEWRANAARTGIADPLPGGGRRCNAPRGTPAGFRLGEADGSVFVHGNLPFCGAANGLVLPDPVVSIAGTPDGHGYWLLLTDGSVYAYGDAKWYGDLRGSAWHGGPMPPGGPMREIVASASGRGYFLLGADGSVYTFGDAGYHGSKGGQPTAGHVVAMALDHATGGYWLVTTEGAIYGFDTPGYGSTLGKRLAGSVVGIASVTDGHGYWLAGSNGGVYNFGNARFFGSAAKTHLNEPIIGIVAGPSGNGYWLAGSNGGVYRYGNIPWYGSQGGSSHAEPFTSVSGP